MNIRLFGAIGLSLFVVQVTLAQDWPQILGPQRNGVAENESLFEEFHEDGLERLWKKSVGQGYAGPVLKDNSLIVFHRIGKEQICERLNADSGEEIWRVTFPATYQGGGVDSDLGPKAVPVIHDDKVILFDPTGQLYCLDFEDGTTLWNRATHTDYRAREGYFGAGSTPLVSDDKVIVNVGGQDAGLVAFQLEDGEEAWKAVSDQASYSSPILNADGTAVIAITRFKAVSVNVADGQVNFEVPFGMRGPTVNAAMPVLVDGHLLINAAYNVGAKWLRLEDDGEPTEVWANNDSYSSQYSTPLFKDGFFYGTAGREDFQDGSFRCVEAETGNVQWSKEMPVGHGILVGARILHVDCKGKLRIVAVNPKAFEEVYSMDLFPVPTRCIPAISRGRLFVRSNAFGPKGQLTCYAIGPDAKKE
jgi:outer membrane protein assembly factor BamB